MIDSRYEIEKKDVRDAEINIGKYRAVMRDFKRYFDGYTRHNRFAQDNLMRFYNELETAIFGDKITNSWV